MPSSGLRLLLWFNCALRPELPLLLACGPAGKALGPLPVPNAVSAVSAPSAAAACSFFCLLPGLLSCSCAPTRHSMQHGLQSVEVVLAKYVVWGGNTFHWRRREEGDGVVFVTHKGCKPQGHGCMQTRHSLLVGAVELVHPTTFPAGYPLLLIAELFDVCINIGRVISAV